MCCHRHVQKEVPFILSQYAIEESPAAVRANIKREFMKHPGTLEPKMVNMLVFKAQVNAAPSIKNLDFLGVRLGFHLLLPTPSRSQHFREL